MGNRKAEPGNQGGTWCRFYMFSFHLLSCLLDQMFFFLLSVLHYFSTFTYLPTYLRRLPTCLFLFFCHFPVFYESVRSMKGEGKHTQRNKEADLGPGIKNDQLAGKVMSAFCLFMGIARVLDWFVFPLLSMHRFDLPLGLCPFACLPAFMEWFWRAINFLLFFFLTCFLA